MGRRKRRQRVYFTIGDGNDIRLQGRRRRGADPPSLAYAISPATGALLWYKPAAAAVCGWGAPCSPAMTAAPNRVGYRLCRLVGRSRTCLCRQRWANPLGVRHWTQLPAVNGDNATGGSIDHGGQVVAGDMLFVTSGGCAEPGNALLAFTVAR